MPELTPAGKLFQLDVEIDDDGEFVATISTVGNDAMRGLAFTGRGNSINEAMTRARQDAVDLSDRILALACRAVPGDDPDAVEEGHT